MNLNHLRTIFRPLLDSGVAVELKSSPGRGKSDFVEETIEIESKADGERWGLSTCMLASFTAPDLLGSAMVAAST